MQATVPEPMPMVSSYDWQEGVNHTVGAPVSYNQVYYAPHAPAAKGGNAGAVQGQAEQF